MLFESGETGFLAPAYAALLAGVLILIGLLLFATQKRATLARRLGLPAPPQSKTLLVAACAVPLLMILAVCRPYWGYELATVSDSDDELMFIVDVSRSMLTKDVPPSRIALARRKMEDLIDTFVASGVPYRYGITLFAGGSYVLCPSTSDIPVVKQFIDHISPDMVTSLGSQLSLGVKTALERVSSGGPEAASRRSRRLVLLSDGEDDQLEVDTTSRAIAASGSRLDVLGIGTPAGREIQLPDGSLVRDAAGAVVTSKLNERSLRELAAAGGGIYVRATLTDADIAQIAVKPRALSAAAQSRASTRQIVTYQELGPLLSALALVTLLGVAMLRRSLLLSLAVIAASAFNVQQTHAQTPAPSDGPTIPLTTDPARQGYELYKEGEFSKSVTALEQALSSNPDNLRVKQALASALFKAGRFSDALSHFRAITEQTKDGREYFENSYNEGNALLALERYQEAIDAYRRALDIKGDDERALHNLRLARKLLEEAKHRPTPTPTPIPTASQSSSQAPRDSKSDPELTPTPNPRSTESAPAEQNSTPPAPNAQQSQSSAGSPTAAPSSAPQSSDARATIPPGTPGPSPESRPSPSTSPSLAPQTAATTTPEGGKDDSAPSDPSQRLKESKIAETEDAPPGTPQGGQPRSSPTPPSAAPLSEAEAWLESLPDSPLIITKERGRQIPRGQTW
jgi:Ca-activated chloride channel family protein